MHSLSILCKYTYSISPWYAILALWENNSIILQQVKKC